VFEVRRYIYDYFLTTEDVFGIFCGFVEKLSLSKVERDLLNWVKLFREKYKRMPTLEELSVRKGEKVDFGGISQDVLVDEFIEFVKNETVKSWIINVADKIEYGKIKVEELFASAKKLVEDFADKEVKLKKFKEVAGKVLEKMIQPVEGEVVSTGFAGLDKVLVGGVRKGEFLCVIAPPGRGKTMCLINMSYGMLVHRENVLFITLELSEEQIVGRFIRRICQKSRKEIRLNADNMKELLDRFCSVAGQLVVKYFRPHCLTVQELGVVIDKVKREVGGLGGVVIDYFDRMKVPVSDYRLGYGFLVDYLRDIALEKNVAVISATQANRASLASLVVTEEHVSESFKKVESSDIVLSFNRSTQDVAKNVGRFVVLKNREWGGVGAQVPVVVDFDKSYIGDV